MNGRVYDYNLGRFLSVDPFIQNPGNSQSMNPYSYIMNNPLSGIDPSGYSAEEEVDDKVTVELTKDTEVFTDKDGNKYVSAGDGTDDLVKVETVTATKNGVTTTANFDKGQFTDVTTIGSQNSRGGGPSESILADSSYRNDSSNTLGVVCGRRCQSEAQGGGAGSMNAGMLALAGGRNLLGASLGLGLAMPFLLFDQKAMIGQKIANDYAAMGVYADKYNPKSNMRGPSLPADVGNPNPDGSGGDDGDDDPENIYNNIKDDPNYPKNFVERQGGTTTHKVKNTELLSKLRRHESGTWNKVYKDGYVNGQKSSLHYFRSQSGRVFGLKRKNYWSN